MMDRLQAMTVFIEVAESGSFAKAGRLLRLSPPAVTRAVAALEARLGTPLLIRTTRSVTLTEAGQRFLADAQRILAELAEAEEAAAGIHAAPRGMLHVTAPVLFGRIYILPILRDFLDRYPDVTGEALFVDRVVNLAEEGIDVAIRIGELPDSGLTAIRVGQVRRIVFGAPAYFADHGEPRHPRELAGHKVISASGATPLLDWRFADADGAVTARVKPLLFMNTLDALIELVLSAWAIARALSYQIAPHVRAGRLKPVLQGFEPAPLPVHVVHREGRRASTKLRAFIDFAVERLRADPALNGER
jgi:DNA-binding transcriptional LysR family regulator